MPANSERRISCEFFPPKTDAGRDKLYQVQAELAKLQPEFFSVTYGAGGSTRDTTRAVVKASMEHGIPVAPHLSFGGDTEETMVELLNEYKAMGVKRIVALRGDLPSGMADTSTLVYANQLVEFIRRHTGDHFHLEVAAYPEMHPEAKSYDSDVDFLKAKFDAGANSAITQYFYNADAYFYFAEECQRRGISQPIYPGIMPITNFDNLVRFSDNCGAEIPRWIRRRLEAYQGDKDSIAAFGLEFVGRLCDTLLEGGAPGIHFYSMNSVEPTTSLCRHLGVEPQ